MAASVANKVILHLRRAAYLHPGAGLTDAELLERYIHWRDDAAFESLVRRHGPMVLGVCRRVLRNEADAYEVAHRVIERLIGELARQIAEHGPGVTGPGPAQAAPVTPYGRTVVRRRMAELGASERAVAGALAVIGDAHPHVLGAVAAVAVQELSCARDALRAAGLLSAGGERFAHNLIAVAIRTARRCLVTVTAPRPQAQRPAGRWLAAAVLLARAQERAALAEAHPAGARAGARGTGNGRGTVPASWGRHYP